MQNRMKQHKLKNAHLGVLFDRELNAMKQNAFSNYKQKRNQVLVVKLNTIT